MKLATIDRRSGQVDMDRIANRSAKANIFVIHGRGEGSYDYDQPLVNFIREQVDNPKIVAYPKLERLERIEQFGWHVSRQELEIALENLADDGHVIGYSLGGVAILKLFSENDNARRINGLFIVAVPYMCRDGRWTILRLITILQRALQIAATFVFTTAVTTRLCQSITFTFTPRN